MEGNSSLTKYVFIVVACKPVRVLYDCKGFFPITSTNTTITVLNDADFFFVVVCLLVCCVCVLCVGKEKGMAGLESCGWWMVVICVYIPTYLG